MAFDQTEDQRLDFMAVIDRSGSVRAAAASAGVHSDTGFRWMRQPGLSTSRSTQRAYSNQQQTKTSESARSGWPRISSRAFPKGRVYPDGRVVPYRPAELLANVKNPRTAWIKGERVGLSRVE